MGLRTDRGDVYVYTLHEPGDDTVYYVGVTSNLGTRLQNHLNDAGVNSTPVAPRNRWIRTLRDRGLAPELRVVAQVPASQGHRAEKAYIRRYFEEGHPLTNYWWVCYRDHYMLESAGIPIVFKAG